MLIESREIDPGSSLQEPKAAWADVWHLWTVILPRRSITGRLVFGMVWRRHDGRRWMQSKDGEAEPMAEIAGDLVAGEGRHVMADDDPLREGLVHGHGEPAAQFGLAEEDETQAVLRIHLVIREETEVLEDIRAEVVGFVDHQDGPDASIGA